VGKSDILGHTFIIQAKAPKFGLSDTNAQKDINSYFVQQQKLATETEHKPREVECIGKVRPNYSCVQLTESLAFVCSIFF
jgi:hypothetical protein